MTQATLIRRRPNRQRQHRLLVCGVLTVAVIAGAALAAPAARACGYHDPQLMARGILNWTYPKALHVGTAVWMAEDAGVLPPRPVQKPRDMFAYQKMVSHLQLLRERLVASPRTDGAPVSFSAILLDSMLWVRFRAEPEGYTLKVHADGPGTGDVVVVTHGKVIKALARGRIDAGMAEKHGLIRLYRNESAHDSLRRLLATPTGTKKPS